MGDERTLAILRAGFGSTVAFAALKGIITRTDVPTLSLRVASMGCVSGAGYLQNRVHPTVRVEHGFLGQRIGHPLAIHHQAVLVGARRQLGLLQPAPATLGMHGLGVRAPVVERARDTNGAGRRMSELEVNRHQLSRAMETTLFMMTFP